MKILVVDDENLIRTTLCRSLERRQHLTSAAQDGAEALAMLERNDFDLVILDLLMPEKNGFDVLIEMKKQIPVIIISAFSGPEEENINNKNYPQVIGFIKKPFEDLQKLLLKIEELYANNIR